jgi:hypothetical protein
LVEVTHDDVELKKISFYGFLSFLFFFLFSDCTRAPSGEVGRGWEERRRSEEGVGDLRDALHHLLVTILPQFVLRAHIELPAPQTP